ncbi:MAG TPA: hypothetical protein VHV78_07285 [Gemmatimonadaceae bacterium]|nr:hypothetical protein [Gemmatimonadaceae bacterium]
MRAVAVVALATIIAAAGATPAAAQGDYEIEVYNSLIAPPKILILELHSNYTFSGQMVPVVAGAHPPLISDDFRAPEYTGTSAASACKPPTVFFDTRPSSTSGSGTAAGGAGAARGPSESIAKSSSSVCTNNAETSHIGHETVEATVGLTSWSEIGLYAFSDEPRFANAQYVGSSIRPKIAVPNSWQWPIGIALSMELEYDRPQVSSDTWSWELRPIIDKSLGRWYLSVNPTLVRTLEGPGAANGVQLSPSGKVNFDFTQLISGGVEYYSAYGRITHVAPAADQVQQIFGAADLHVSALWEINVGVGIAETPATNHLVAKVIFGRSFSLARTRDTQ